MKQFLVGRKLSYDYYNITKALFLIHTEDLEALLAERGVAPGDWSIGKIRENTYVLLVEGRVWKTFFIEKGHRSCEQIFATESDACSFFLWRLTNPNDNTPWPGHL